VCWTKLCGYYVTSPSGLIALVMQYNVCFFLFLLVVCVNLWNGCVLCNVEQYTDFLFHVDGVALCLGQFFCLAEWGGK
jgi:hypothetical protein